MPKKDGTGPPKNAIGPKDGSGKGKGNYSKEKGQGKQTSGSKGKCK